MYVETHISQLLFTENLVHKRKRALDLEFVDFRTLAARRQACIDEVALNRRLAPDVYLGVSELRGADGQPLDYFVTMRRLPEDRRLGAVFEADPAAGQREVRRLAQLIARFHGGLQPAVDGGRIASRDAIRRLWRQSLRTLAGAPEIVANEEVAAVRTRAFRYLAGRRRLFDARIAAGRVVEGHGDLLADDVFCLPDGPRVLDCLEFDRRLRVGDTLSDVCFLAMDLERLGADEGARTFLDTYRDCSGDDWPDSLEHLYIAYRGLVRAKVAALRAKQRDGTDDRAQARALIALALRHLDRGRVRLVVVGGLPGTGKSRLCGHLINSRDWTVLSSDRTRRELVRGTQPTGAGFASRYSKAWTGRTYRNLLKRAQLELEHGRSVVLDASFIDPQWRTAARELAQRTASDLHELQCVARDDVVRRRLAARTPDASNFSEATVDIYERMRLQFPDWPEAIVVRTDRPGALDAVLALVDG